MTPLQETSNVSSFRSTEKIADLIEGLSIMREIRIP